MFKPFSFIFFVAVMVWIGAILITTEPQSRMGRACVPISATGVAAEAAMGLVNQDWGTATAKVFETWDFGCKHVIWSVFYKNDYMRNQQLQAEIEASNARAKATGHPASSAR